MRRAERVVGSAPASAAPLGGGLVEWDWKLLGIFWGCESRGRKNDGRRRSRRGRGVLEEKYVLETVRRGVVCEVALIVAFAVFVVFVERNRWIVRPRGRPIIAAIGVRKWSWTGEVGDLMQQNC